MRIICRHGHFAFYPKDAHDIASFADLFTEELVRVGDFYTFSFLKDAPDFSIQGKPFLGLPAVKTFEGAPWEVMRENGFVYNVAAKAIVPKASIVLLSSLELSRDFWTTENPLVQPGSRMPSGEQILSYDAEYIRQASQLRVFEVQYV